MAGDLVKKNRIFEFRVKDRHGYGIVEQSGKESIFYWVEEQDGYVLHEKVMSDRVTFSKEEYIRYIDSIEEQAEILLLGL